MKTVTQLLVQVRLHLYLTTTTHSSFFFSRLMVNFIRSLSFNTAGILSIQYRLCSNGITEL